MVASAGTITVPIYAKFNGKEFHVGDLTLDVKVVNGRVKAPTTREIAAAFRKAR